VNVESSFAQQSCLRRNCLFVATPIHHAPPWCDVLDALYADVAMGALPQLMEVLQHLNKRLKAQPSVQLPCEALRGMLVGSNIMQVNFALMYLTMGLPRLPAAQRGAFVPKLLTGVSGLAPATARKVRSRAALRVCLCFVFVWHSDVHASSHT